ncbi:MAG: FxDxF family PEP-CTERM protein [Aquabacterium sp.]|jgi:hypothetical protein
MQLKQLAAASLLAVSTFAAHAAAVPPNGNLGPLTELPEVYFSFTTEFAPSTFSNNYFFSITGLSDVIGSVGAINNTVTFTDILINGISVGPLTANNNGFGFSMSDLDVGSYTLTVKGNAAPGFSGYVGSIYAQPVPEPESIALMLAGLGVVGAVAARRRKAH